jgi:hypothetical protein
MGFQKGDFDHVIEKFPEERKGTLDWWAWNTINDPEHPSHRLAKAHLSKMCDLNYKKNFPHDIGGGMNSMPMQTYVHDTVVPLVGGYMKLVGYVFGFWFGSS